MTTSYDVVVPTSGRASLSRTLAGLAAGGGPWPQAVLVVDDRPGDQRGQPLSVHCASGALRRRIRVLSDGASQGPAAARNRGWREGSAEWVAFLDDDVVPRSGWRRALSADLDDLGPDVGASQGRVHVPLPEGRRPTDWERNVAGLESAVWATADMAYRRSVLAELGGFDERFPRPYREDADLGLRTVASGRLIARGRRLVVHPVPKPRFLVSLHKQSGNADDPLMRRLHGRWWYERAGSPRGRRRGHVLATALATASLAAAALGRHRAATGLSAGWLAITAKFAWTRIAAGPRTPGEMAAMAVTSVLLPPAAAWHWLRGWARFVRAGAARPAAVLIDRDGTLIEDVPYNHDPKKVRPMPGVRRALERLRQHGVPVAVITNQSGVGRGLITREQVEAVQKRVNEALGPFDEWLVCPHVPEDRCRCRKPAPGLIEEAAARLGVPAARCVVIGDIGADVQAAHAAGAQAILVPTRATRLEEVAVAPVVAADFPTAVGRLLGIAQ